MNTPPLVLVVEDNPVVRKMLRAALASDGYEVAEAPDGETAVAIATQRLPQLVLLDLLLPDMEGTAVLRRLRELEGGDEIVAIALSGHALGLEAARDVPLEFTDLIFKPVEPSRLLSIIAARLRPHGAEAAGRGQVVLVADDDPVQRKLVRIQLEQRGYNVRACANGQEALESALASPPSVVLSDVLMPGMDGFQLCASLRRQLPDVPVVLMSSAYDDVEDRAVANLAGASALVLKTPGFDEALAAVAAALEPGVEPPTPTHAPVLDREHSARLMRQLDRQAEANASLARQSAAQAAQLAVLAGVGDTFAASTDVAQMATELLVRCAAVANITHGAAWVRSDGGLDLVASVGFGGVDAERIHHHPKILGYVEAVMRRRDPIVVGRDEKVTRAEVAEVMRDAGFTSAVVIPLLQAGGEALGALAIGTSAPSFTEDQVMVARAGAAQLAQAIALTRSLQRVASMQEEAIRRLVRAAEFRDDETIRHTERVSQYCGIIARRAGLDSARCDLIERASVMHDVGKLGVPDSILLKPGLLTPEERRVMERHPEYGHSILAGSGLDMLEMAASIALTHHERWDGGGYPRGLIGEEIPIEGRIVAIADVFDALTSDRVYRPAMETGRALEILEQGRGAHFESRLLDCFIGELDRVTEVRVRSADLTPAGGRVGALAPR